MIEIGLHAEYLALVKEMYGDDVSALQRALAFKFKHHDILQNRCNAYREDRAPVQTRRASDG